MNVAITFSVSLRTWPGRPRRIAVLGTILIIIVVLGRSGCSVPEALTLALTAAGTARALLATGTLPEVNP